MPGKQIVKLTAAISSFLLLFSSTGYSDPLYTVSSKLVCQCGCTMVLSTCQCETAEKMRDKIKFMIGKGKGEDEIIASFISVYGEKVLEEPFKKGFSLLAYIIPFAAIFSGGICIWWLARRWTGVSRKKEKKAEQVEEEYQEKVHRELDEYEF